MLGSEPRYYVVVAATRSLRAGEELFVQYSFKRPKPARRKREERGESIDIPLGRPRSRQES